MKQGAPVSGSTFTGRISRPSSRFTSVDLPELNRPPKVTVTVLRTSWSMEPFSCWARFSSTGRTFSMQACMRSAKVDLGRKSPFCKYCGVQFSPAGPSERFSAAGILSPSLLCRDGLGCTRLALSAALRGARQGLLKFIPGLPDLIRVPPQYFEFVRPISRALQCILLLVAQGLFLSLDL